MFKRPKTANLRQTPPTRWKQLLNIVGFIAVIGSTVAILWPAVSSSQAWTLATTHQPERFTELYFSHPQSLPTNVTTGKPVTVVYHITNQEAATTIYRPQVTLTENGHSRLISQAYLVLAAGQGSDLTVTFTTTLPHAQLEFVISLPDQQQTIQFRSQS